LYLYDSENDTAHLHLRYQDGQIISGSDIHNIPDAFPPRFTLSEDLIVSLIAQTQAPLIVEELVESPLGNPLFQA
jgi:hypothetical protein